MDAKEAEKAYVVSRTDEAEELLQDIASRDHEIETLLSSALERDPQLIFDEMRRTFKRTPFDSSKWTAARPIWDNYEPAPFGFMAGLIPGASKRRQKSLDDAKAKFDQDCRVYDGRVAERDAARAKHEQDELQREREILEHNADIDALEIGLVAYEHSAVVGCYSALIGKSLNSDIDATGSEVGYSPESRHLVVDLELPEISVVPEEANFKYVKSADRIDVQMRPVNKRRALYASLINQSVLKCIDAIFRGGAGAAVDCLTLNGMLDTINPADGQPVRLCLLSVRVTFEGFKSLNLRQVHPDQCLRALKASVSRSPAELLPVRPLVEIDMVDPRFIETRDVLSELDRRPNLMELTPGEFESVITNLFAAMGLETRQTQASRDGGVDCVAFDLRPIFGGKVVIQAKRYKNTVDVSAVRDLYGTLQNEGANRGILVTTSGYGKASHDFAKGKPLELIDGSGLLYLLAEHAKIEAKIVPPSTWVDQSNSFD